MNEVKNIILDLGGVLLTLDYQKTEQAFIDLGIANFNEWFTQHHANPLFEALETGKLSEKEFYTTFQSATGINATEAQIKTAWNALLGHFPEERIQWLATLKERYTLFLFSNTNIIHYNAVMQTYFEAYGSFDFNERFFKKAYYSHQMGLRKPYPESFMHIAKEQCLLPEQTLFIDDTPKNIEAAKALGFQTILLTPPATVLDLSL